MEDKQKREMRITEDDLKIIKATFKGNERLLKLLRKVFFPEITLEAPLGQQIDLWMTIPLQNLTPEQAMINILARNQLISHIEQQLLQLRILAESDAKTIEEIRESQKKDSSK